MPDLRNFVLNGAMRATLTAESGDRKNCSLQYAPVPVSVVAEIILRIADDIFIAGGAQHRGNDERRP